MGNETKIGIDVQASTAAAKAALGDLGAETRKFTEAGEAAGKAQKKLGQEVAETKSRQMEATEAIRRVKAAQEEHNLTVQAFGPKSAQAKASADALSAANREAARAAEVAAKALEKTAARAVEAAKAEGENLSPATQRLAKELQAMGGQADKTAQEMRKLDAQSQKTSYGFSVTGLGAGKAAGAMSKVDASSYKTGRGFDLMGLAGGKLMSVLGPAALGGTLIGLASWLGEASAATLQYETAIANLPFALDGARAATHGLMSETALAVSASQAMALGVVKTEGEFNQLASDAAKIALKLGTSTDKMLGDLTTALGRGSAMILDNAGIILKVSDANEAYARSVGKTVEQLDEAEKKLAFQTAAMKAIRESADQTKVAYDSNAAALARMKIGVGDAWDAMERGAVNGAGSVVQAIMSIDDELPRLQAAADAAAREMMRSGDWSQGFKDTAAAVGLAAVELGGFSDVLTHFQNVINDPQRDEKLAASLGLEREKRDLMSQEAHFAELQAKALEKINKDMESHLEAQAAASVVYGPAPPPKAEKKKASGKKQKTALDIVKSTEFIHDESDLVNEMFEADSLAQQKRDDEAAEHAEKLHGQKLQRIDEEMELLEVRGIAERQSVDAVFYTIEIESEAERARQAMLDERLRREKQFAAWQLANAKTDKQREEAQTRVEQVEHKRRLAAAQKAHAAEVAEQTQRAKMFERVNSHITGLGDALVTAVWAQAEGEKGAVAASVAAYAKGVSQKMALKALEETALGVAALAGIVTAGLAPPHFAAAALAAAAAVAAGGAAVGFGKLATSQGHGSREDKWAKQQEEKEAKAQWKEEHGYGPASKPGGSHSGGAGKPPSSGNGGGDDDGVPTSYVEAANYQKRNMQTSREPVGGNVINYNFPGMQVLGGTQEQVGIAMERLIRKAGQSAGKTR